MVWLTRRQAVIFIPAGLAGGGVCCKASTDWVLPNPPFWASYSYMSQANNKHGEEVQCTVYGMGKRCSVQCMAWGRGAVYSVWRGEEVQCTVYGTRAMVLVQLRGAPSNQRISPYIHIYVHSYVYTYTLPRIHIHTHQQHPLCKFAFKDILVHQLSHQCSSARKICMCSIHIPWWDLLL